MLPEKETHKHMGVPLYIRGLVNTSPGERQFFISTCEDRLFELMRKKFSGVAGGAKFYRFEAIGQDGPIVKEL